MMNITLGILSNLYRAVGSKGDDQVAHIKLASAIENVFKHAIENAMDAYLQKRDGELTYQETLKLYFYSFVRAGDIIIWMVANGVSLERAEYAQEKANATSRRLGGRHEGTRFIILHAYKIEGETNLLDRMKKIGDEDGAIFELKLKRDFMRYIASDLPVNFQDIKANRESIDSDL